MRRSIPGLMSLTLCAVLALASGCETPGQADPVDTSSPTINAVNGLTDGATVAGTVDITAEATDNLGVTGFTLTIDGAEVASETSGSLAYSWDTTAEADGEYTLVFKARDALGNSDTETYTVTVNNTTPIDDEDPVVDSVTGVTDMETVSGTVDITATATDNVEVTGFTLAIGGAEVASDTDGALEYSWDTTAEFDDDYVLLFTASDAAANTGTATLTVTVDNSAPTGATVSGVVYAPNGTDPVSGALVYAVDPGGGSAVSATGDPPAEDYLAFDYSEADGSFALTEVPVGTQTFKVLKGAFTLEFEYEVVEGDNELPDETTTLPSTTADGGTVDQLVVVTGDFDRIENVLAKIGLGEVDGTGELVPGTEEFTLVDGNETLDDGDYANFLDFMDDPANYADARTIFLNCGNAHEADFFADPDMANDLKAWVEGGGRLYASDRSYDFVEQLFPAAVDFYGGADGLSDTAEEVDAAELGNAMLAVDAEILDAALLAWLQALEVTNEDDTITIEGWLDSWAAIEDLAAETLAWVEAPVMVESAASTRTVAVTFATGDGTVFFTSCHTEETPTVELTPQDRLLQYFVFEVL